MRLNQPVLGMERTRSGKGYWLFASDGGVFTFGDAKFYGSAGSRHLTSPVVAMQRTPAGNGYWMLAPDGDVLRVRRRPQATATSAAAPTTAAPARLLVSPSGKGYWIVDGRRQRRRLR